MEKHIYQAIRERILGKKIKEIKDDSVLVLEDGTRLELYESEQDCCAGAGGDWEILEADDLEAGITDIEFVDRHHYEGDYIDSAYSTMRINILHNQNPLASAECYADSGNGGYYFSALSLRVVVPGLKDLMWEVLDSVE